MQAKNFVQLELPLNLRQSDPLNQMEEAIQSMLDLTWKTVLIHISDNRRSIQELMRQHGKLVAINDGEARIKVSSLPIFRLAQKAIPDVEKAFLKAFGIRIKISLEL